MIESLKCLNGNINELNCIWIVVKLLKNWCLIRIGCLVLNYVCNEVKLWSRHSIFWKGNIMLRLLLGCIDLWVSCEWDDPDSTGIMESYKWSYSVGESRRRFIYLSLRFERIDQSIWNGFTLSYEMMIWLCAWLCGFTVSSMIGAGLWMLISIHESSGSRVKCLSIWVSRNLAGVMWMINMIDTWWNWENVWILMVHVDI